MTNPKDPDPINRLDQIIDQLAALYTEADQIIDSSIEEARRRVAPRGRQFEPTGNLQ
jgi:hypothetical protein